MNNKSGITGVVFFLIVMIINTCLIGSITTTDAQAQTVDAPILLIKQVLDYPEQKPPQDRNFDYILIPEDASYPLPDGSTAQGLLFSIEGNDEMSIGPLAFDGPGVYSYQIKHLSRQRSDCFCDQRIYTVEFWVARDMDVSIITYGADGLKVDEIYFTHHFLEGTDSGDADPPLVGASTVSATSTAPKTGDSFPYEWVLMLLGGSTCVLILSIRPRRIDEKEDR
ncbi:MAG: hypothetical protein FWE87_02095 [Coriobacteriia bacterium]|nr:hypothetical protein [Coriobacteriia bacterium]